MYSVIPYEEDITRKSFNWEITILIKCIYTCTLKSLSFCKGSQINTLFRKGNYRYTYRPSFRRFVEGGRHTGLLWCA